ncbi:unnamed protein product [Amoebophrya sp. A120]|nr:unnamed protein product [Amoebophrya sp. A120]|eukprot:GSA120T00017633001.1
MKKPAPHCRHALSQGAAVDQGGTALRQRWPGQTSLRRLRYYPPRGDRRPGQLLRRLPAPVSLLFPTPAGAPHRSRGAFGGPVRAASPPARAQAPLRGVCVKPPGAGRTRGVCREAPRPCPPRASARRGLTHTGAGRSSFLWAAPPGARRRAGRFVMAVARALRAGPPGWLAFVCREGRGERCEELKALETGFRNTRPHFREKRKALER